MKQLVLALITLFSHAALAADGGYLFVTFRGEGSAEGEQVYFGLSKDGIRWEALNGGKPALVSPLGEKGARDPYLLRGQDARFYLIATDLSIYHNRDWGRAVRAGSHAILIWESGTLTNWAAPRLVTVAPPDAGCTWAPETIYDPASQKYLVYWASTTKRDNFAKHRIWGAWTKDFHDFSKPFIYIEKPTTVIDTDIVQAEDGKYYRFTKDEKFKAITMEVGETLTGEWKDVKEFSLATLKGYEGPACFALKSASGGKPGTWCLLLDYYSRGQGYKPFTTENLAGGQFVAGTAFEFPFRFRHGSVLPVTAKEYDALKARYGDPSR